MTNHLTTFTREVRSRLERIGSHMDYSNADDLAKALAIIDCMREALMEITAECNSELAQVCPNEDCDYQSIGAVKCVNICDSTLAQASAIAEGKE